MTMEEAIANIELILGKNSLNKVEKLIICQCWEQKTYAEIAENYGYDADYIKFVGFRLWKMLSEALGEKVSKNNFRLVLKQRHSKNTSEKKSYSVDHNLNTSKVITIGEDVTNLTLPEYGVTDLERGNFGSYLQTNFGSFIHSPTPFIHKSNNHKTASGINYRTDYLQKRGNLIDISTLYGRSLELAELEQWIIKERCQLIAVLGIGGIGKTALSLKLAKQIQDKFEHVVFRSLHNAPSLDYLIQDLIQLLTNQQQINSSKDVNALIWWLLNYLQKHRCLIVLDNVETILCSAVTSDSSYDCKAGHYREGYKDYGQFFKWIGELRHNSCIVLTSREKPKEIAALEGDNFLVRSLQLSGLEVEDGQIIFRVKGNFEGSVSDWITLIQSYMGNPLALKIVATTIKDLFGGDISKFLSQGTVIFGDIKDLLEQQFQRLSPLEKEIMYWLAINREPVTISDLHTELLTPVLTSQLIEAIESLERRCVLERATHSQSEKGDTFFTLHPVLMEYITTQLIQHVISEIQTRKISIYKTHALFQAQTKDYIQDIQIQIILKPIINQLLNLFGHPDIIKNQLLQIISSLQGKLPTEIGYAGGNTLNLLCQFHLDLSAHDFSNLVLWQADLRNTKLQGVNFSYSNLAKSVFTESFSHIYSLAVSPDSKLVAIGDTQGKICLLQMSDGQLVSTWDAHTGWVYCLTFSIDGQMLISGSDDQTIKLWDINSGQCQQTLLSKLWVTALNCNNQTLVNGSAEQIIQLWDINTGQLFRSLYGHEGWVWSVVLSPDGQTLASCGADQTIKLWNLNTGQCLKTLHGHEDIVCDVVFTQDGQTLISGSSDRTVRLWNVQTGECIQILQGHTDSVWSVSLGMKRSAVSVGINEAESDDFALTNEIAVTQEPFILDHLLLASAGADHRIKLWDISTGQVIKTLQGHSYGISSIVFSADSQILISKDVGQTIKLWNIQTGQCFKTFQGYSGGVWSIALSPDGQTIIGSGEDQMVKLWNIRSSKCLKVFKGHNNWVMSVAFSPDGQTIASCGADRLVRLWDVHTGQCLKTFEGHSRWVLKVVYSSDGKILASCGEDQLIRFWDIQTGKCVQTLRGHAGLVTSIVYSPDGHTFASSGTDRIVRIWDLSTGQCLKVLKDHTNWIRAILYHPNGQTLASSGEDHLVRIWDVSTGQCMKVLHGHTNSVMTIAYSPDGRFLASGSTDRTIRVWDANTGQCLQVLKEHTKRVYSVAFTILHGAVSSKVNTVLASSSEDQTLRFWDVETGQCLKVMRIRPYEDMNITGVTGVTEIQKATLKALGAFENCGSKPKY
ncbi:hypothetical protein BLD44_027820 [Mastigocladus laminosus UU774]|nr:hypothetical protein BLD44_027820 [Mastigocladus laminosus UU774]